MPLIQVSAKEIDEFDVAIALACLLQSPERLENKVSKKMRLADYAVPDYFYSQDGCLVVSFDGGWFPFLDNTRGYNRGPQRWYIPKTSELLARVARSMQTAEQRRILGAQAGGRVFLHSTGALRRPEAMPELELLTWYIEGRSCYLCDRVTTTFTGPP